MTKSDIDDYLQQGIHGAREIKPDERRKFLGTLRERVVVALTERQVKRKGIHQKVEELMTQHPKAKLLLNGTIDYTYFSEYMELAEELGMQYRFVSNQASDTEMGLILAYEHAIEREEIFLEDEDEKEISEASEGRISLFIKRLFH
ncbi:YueI family protein [Ammoniphilus sp. CFH 90114]|uniref:YueI family protein n=1 Tax=Ammoniphilus sp. CFH 90114 TaxID=2493665 RepID=UPI00100F5563|nr:YueI family protein [Ammoniphilus sp. CFH 90114]RXT06422.1 DUF1694 domain-containing protein [Ammoniphilus sp. CFH 90114]